MKKINYIVAYILYLSPLLAVAHCPKINLQLKCYSENQGITVMEYGHAKIQTNYNGAAPECEISIKPNQPNDDLYQACLTALQGNKVTKIVPNYYGVDRVFGWWDPLSYYNYKHHFTVKYTEHGDHYLKWE